MYDVPLPGVLLLSITTTYRTYSTVDGVEALFTVPGLPMKLPPGECPLPLVHPLGRACRAGPAYRGYCYLLYVHQDT